LLLLSQGDNSPKDSIVQAWTRNFPGRDLGRVIGKVQERAVKERK
jgi:hypothetical protein